MGDKTKPGRVVFFQINHNNIPFFHQMTINLYLIGATPLIWKEDPVEGI